MEFALIAPAFIATLVAMMQTCIFLVCADGPAKCRGMEAGRYFMTGQAQNNGWTASTIVKQGLPVGAVQLQPR